MGGAVNNIVLCVEVENAIDEFDLDKVLSETYDDDFGELVKAETFLNPEEENIEEKKDSGM